MSHSHNVDVLLLLLTWHNVCARECKGALLPEDMSGCEAAALASPPPLPSPLATLPPSLAPRPLRPATRLLSLSLRLLTVAAEGADSSLIASPSSTSSTNAISSNALGMLPRPLIFGSDFDHLVPVLEGRVGADGKRVL